APPRGVGKALWPPSVCSPCAPATTSMTTGSFTNAKSTNATTPRTTRITGLPTAYALRAAPQSRHAEDRQEQEVGTPPIVVCYSFTEIPGELVNAKEPHPAHRRSTVSALTRRRTR